MSVTRLLVLGAVRIFQPAHGYLVRRELLSWQVEEWANVKPGSVYNALRTLTRDGLLLEEEAPVAVGGTGPGARATYRLTPDGESEFFRLEREALWQLHPSEPGWLFAGMSFWFTLSRQEVLDALAGRRSQLESRLTGVPYLAEEVRGSGKPAHIVEYVHMMEAGLRAELAWVEGAEQRLREGSYGFADEDRRRVYGLPSTVDTGNIQV